MRFAKLRLTGFKSFVDPTDLIIEDGLTGVVGPNGCGKSNLLEALRWVMGENRPSAMRGGGMEDVIFAGVATRPARNFAEVALHLDNAQRLAPPEFNDIDHLEIVRRITRDSGSAYKIAGKDVRARDVQMLFADASTGAHSPALVRQGQIAELISAKPKNRRRVLEEAAGISGLYARRHEAELKLHGAEANLARVDDVVEQLAVQLAQLARQARQASRYRQIAEQLRRAEGMLLYRRWRNAEESQTRAEAELRDVSTAVAVAEARVKQIGDARSAVEQALPQLREEDAVAGAILQRLIGQTDALDEQEARAGAAIETLQTRIGQLTLDLEREAALNRDADESVKRLQREANQLQQASEGHENAFAATARSSREAADDLAAQEAALAKKTEDVARLMAAFQSAEQLLDVSRKGQRKAEIDAARATEAVLESRAALGIARTEFEAALTAENLAIAAAAKADEALAAAEKSRAKTQLRETVAQAERSETVGEMIALRTEKCALAKLLAGPTAEHGQILDHVHVEPGFEMALGAALADDLHAPEVEGVGPSGWALLPVYRDIQTLPEGVISLTRYVSVPDALAHRLSQIGLVDAGFGATLQPLLKPGQRLVSREGDLWRWDGFRGSANDAPSAAALRLQQINRLEVVRQSLDQATQRADAAEATHDALQRQLAELAEIDSQARIARREADAAVIHASRARSKAETDRTLREARLETLDLAVKRHNGNAMAARVQMTEATLALAEIGDISKASAEIDKVRLVVETARNTMVSRRVAHDELCREGVARLKRGQEVARELAGWCHRLETAELRAAELMVHKLKSEGELAMVSAGPANIAEQRNALSDQIILAETRKTKATDALLDGESVFRDETKAERDAERQASEVRETRARSEARAEAARETIAVATARIAEESRMTPDQLLASLDILPDQMPTADTLEADVNRFKLQRDALGAVNLRAEADAKEVEAEHHGLVSEKVDLEAAIRSLRSGIANLNREGRARLLTAFGQVNSNFSMLFKHLFDGGEAKLVMVESDDPLEAGLEILCQPPGKKLSTLSLLSGGEQTLTAMALIFAVFLANPAPICVLDEVDAPLDDANVTRFCDLLDEMCRQTKTRFLIITHHAVTMARMDRLFGVTMAEQGVSQLVSVDLKKAETMVA